MSTIDIDLRAKPVNSDVNLWRVFPGRGYGLLGRFLEDSVVFPDLPEAVLPEGTISEATPHIKELVKRSLAFDQYYAERTEFLRTGKGSAPTRPNTSIPSYTLITKSPKKVSNGVNAIIDMFGNAQKGDLIVMPEPKSTQVIRIGEFSESPSSRPLIEFKESCPGSKASSRKVRWLAKVDEWRLPLALTQSLRHEIAISKLDTTHLLDVMDFAYDAYFFGANTKAIRIRTTAHEFNDQDGLDIHLLIKLCATLAWPVDTAEEDARAFTNYIGRILPDDANLSIKSNINSPGWLNLKGTTLGPMLFMVLFTLAINCPSDSKPDPSSVNIVNSSGQADEASTLAVQEMVRQSMVYMREADWVDLRARSKRLEANPRLHVAGRATVSR